MDDDDRTPWPREYTRAELDALAEALGGPACALEAEYAEREERKKIRRTIDAWLKARGIVRDR